MFLGAGLEGETVVVTGGLLAHQGLIPLVPTMIAAAAGSFCADQIFFQLGRRYRDRGWVRRMTARPAFARALAAVERHPAGFIVAFRFLYGLRTISPVAIGTTRVPTRRFVALNLVAAIGWGVIFTGLGYVFGHGIAALLGRMHLDRRTLLIGAGAALALIAVVGAIRRRRGRA